MALTTYKPTTNARRGMMSQDTSEITTKKPLKSLTTTVKRHKGRNNQGRITTRHKGGGSSRKYRNVSFELPFGYEGIVEHIEYDPNRTARIARLKDSQGNYRYIIATHGMKQGQKIQSCWLVVMIVVCIGSSTHDYFLDSYGTSSWCMLKDSDCLVNCSSSNQRRYNPDFTRALTNSFSYCLYWHLIYLSPLLACRHVSGIFSSVQIHQVYDQPCFP